MKITTLILSLFCVYTLNAQLITISETHQIPQVGDTVMYKNANTFGFDADGTGTVTDKLWDFSALMDADTNEVLFWWDSPVGLEGTDSFPTANMARGGNQEDGYFFYENTSNNIDRLGWYGDETNYGIYINSLATEFTFPFTAGDNHSTDYHGHLNPFGAGEDSVTIEQGSLSLQADMQGTLILPTGSFDDVLRIHDIESFHVKAYISGVAATDNIIEDDYYYWFVDTIFQPILIYGTTDIDGDQQSEVLRYQPIETSTNINTINKINIRVFPNPSNGLFNIEGKNITSLKLIDINGKNINIEFKSFSKLDLSSLENGVYFLKITTTEGSTMRKLVIE